MHFIAINALNTGAVLEITLNRPEVRNAMSLAMVGELRRALAQAESTIGTPDAIRVVVLRGAGGHFCAGGDLKDMAAARMRALQDEGDAASTWWIAFARAKTFRHWPM